jgi:hypothetical protein
MLNKDSKIQDLIKELRKLVPLENPDAPIRIMTTTKTQLKVYDQDDPLISCDLDYKFRAEV